MNLYNDRWEKQGIGHDAAGGGIMENNQYCKPWTSVNTFVCYRGNDAVTLNLNADLISQIEDKLLQPRINAASLADLAIHFEVMPQFISYLSHVGGFVLPTALGDCYMALGNYDTAVSYYKKARNYKYLNLAIERPAVWIRMAKAYLRKGVQQYRNRDNAGAQKSFEKHC